MLCSVIYRSAVPASLKCRGSAASGNLVNLSFLAYQLKKSILIIVHYLYFLFQPLELFPQTPAPDGSRVRITIKLVGELAVGDYHYIQFFNILMRMCLGHLKLQLVGRNYFDARAKIPVTDFRLELWPGYVTSIRPHESDVLMCSEITHKVMRNDTVYDVLDECYRQEGPQGFQVIRQLSAF